MELMIMCVIAIALGVAWFVAYYSGLSAGTLALAWLIGALLTFALQWVARRYRWENYYSDTLAVRSRRLSPGSWSCRSCWR